MSESYTKVYHIVWREDLLDILAPKLNGAEVQNVVKKIDCISDDISGGEEKPFGEFQVSYPLSEGETLAGIDIPCLVQRREASANKKIMIIGEAPRRNIRSKNCCCRCTVGTPYAIRNYGFPNSCKTYKNIIDPLLVECDIYLTDAIKVWSNVRQKHLEPCPNELLILKNEIECVQPYKIVTFGRVAMDAVHKVYDEIWIKPQLCHLYHPSYIAIRHWKRKTCVKSVLDISSVAVCLINSEEQVNMFDKEWKFSKNKNVEYEKNDDERLQHCRSVGYHPDACKL